MSFENAFYFNCKDAFLFSKVLHMSLDRISNLSSNHIMIVGLNKKNNVGDGKIRQNEMTQYPMKLITG